MKQKWIIDLPAKHAGYHHSWIWWRLPFTMRIFYCTSGQCGNKQHDFL